MAALARAAVARAEEARATAETVATAMAAAAMAAVARAAEPAHSTQHTAYPQPTDPHAEVHSYCMRGTGSGRARMRVAGGGSGAQRTAFALGVFYHATTAKWRGPSHVPNRAQSSSPVHGVPYRGHPNFYKDETTGTPHTYMGHHTLILKVGSPLRRRWHTLLGDGQTPSHNCQP